MYVKQKIQNIGTTLFTFSKIGSNDFNRLSRKSPHSGLPTVEKKFDCVLCSDVLEHLDNLHHIFGELRLFNANL